VSFAVHRKGEQVLPSRSGVRPNNKPVLPLPTHELNVLVNDVNVRICDLGKRLHSREHIGLVD
jgi:hypothetical protein